MVRPCSKSFYKELLLEKCNSLVSLGLILLSQSCSSVKQSKEP
ncbi:rCG22993, isoform CRA_a [Rattus norvegicus]|uniref:RCG22993, isoform CRA_a n=1 Tax=Rattus norvegicus TaxID=10116 RepID=A6KBB9_RAT|nr:rCG22993, isoform CRA_a [Rattus norvegicus]